MVVTSLPWLLSSPTAGSNINSVAISAIASGNIISVALIETCFLMSISLAHYNSHTQALSRHTDTIAINKKVCFYRWLFPTLSSNARPAQTLWGHWDALIE